jgi:ABC-type sugar transport system ATPase subunit
MSFLELKNVTKIYPNGTKAVHETSLSIEEGEFMVFVGPSGCGKSTLLRMVAGLEDITEGEITLDGNLINELTHLKEILQWYFKIMLCTHI